MIASIVRMAISGFAVCLGLVIPTAIQADASVTSESVGSVRDGLHSVSAHPQKLDCLWHNKSQEDVFDRDPFQGDAHLVFEMEYKHQCDGTGWIIADATARAGLQADCGNFDQSGGPSVRTDYVRVTNGSGATIAQKVDPNLAVPSCSHTWWPKATSFVDFNTQSGQVCYDGFARVDHSDDLDTHICLFLSQFGKARVTVN